MANEAQQQAWAERGVDWVDNAPIFEAVLAPFGEVLMQAVDIGSGARVLDRFIMRNFDVSRDNSDCGEGCSRVCDRHAAVNPRRGSHRPRHSLIREQLSLSTRV